MCLLAFCSLSPFYQIMCVLATWWDVCVCVFGNERVRAQFSVDSVAFACNAFEHLTDYVTVCVRFRFSQWHSLSILLLLLIVPFGVVALDDDLTSSLTISIKNRSPVREKCITINITKDETYSLDFTRSLCCSHRKTCSRPPFISHRCAPFPSSKMRTTNSPLFFIVSMQQCTIFSRFPIFFSSFFFTSYRFGDAI